MSTKLTVRPTWTFEIEVLPTLEIGGGLGPDPDPHPALLANTSTIRANKTTARANGFPGA